ncbi:DedA family protein [Brevibacillus nitrificans]|uniref:DedA family protein n=1 Tax=Brevibacillus nitrificans TaxID=651560 RepID=UPI00285DEF99|nr:DedA family protein [Brevibacillus nitrificans]MDR7316538.1 membrane protein DedA with SNARE-associated domain [Brevibacillus nitrificans]
MEEMMSSFGGYITQYGYGALFGLFFLGILGMPLPEETLLVFSGFLVSTGKLDYWPTFLVCFLGSVTAMTAAYWIGRTLGYTFIERYGKRFGLGYTVYKRTEDWFNRVGKWALPVGYFIPGVRQFTAYFAGITRLPFPTFMLYTYLGGLFWSLLFVTIGWQLGERWDEMFDLISRNLAIVCLGVLAIIAIWSYARHRVNMARKSKRGESQ